MTQEETAANLRLMLAARDMANCLDYLDTGPCSQLEPDIEDQAPRDESMHVIDWACGVAICICIVAGVVNGLARLIAGWAA